MTPSKSQKTNNIQKNNKVSIAINRPYQTWNEIQGVSLAAHATRVLDAEEIDRVGNMILRKFPEAKNFANEEMGDLALFRIDPIVISLLDYAMGFGHTECITL